MKAPSLSLVILLTTPGLAWSQAQAPLPQVATRGLEFLRTGHADSAFATWAGKGYLPEQRQGLLDAVPMFNRVCATVVGYDLLKVVDLSAHLRRAYFLIRCPDQPLYLMLVLYQGEGDWSVAALNWHSDADRVLPATVFGEQQPRPPQ